MQFISLTVAWWLCVHACVRVCVCLLSGPCRVLITFMMENYDSGKADVFTAQT